MWILVDQSDIWSPKFYQLFFRLSLNKIFHFLIPLIAKVCGVCGSPATEVQHYGSISCYSCRSVPDCKNDDEGYEGGGDGTVVVVAMKMIIFNLLLFLWVSVPC